VACAFNGVLTCTDGTAVCFDECVWCTQGRAQGWVKAAGLAVDAGGFMRVYPLFVGRVRITETMPLARKAWPETPKPQNPNPLL
jgi:hypothetical protein